MAETHNSTVNKVYEFKIRANKSFIKAAENILSNCRDLYNGCLEQRISHYLYTGKSPNWIEQCRQLTDLRASSPEQKAIPRHIQTDVIRRLEKAYISFFRRCKNGETPGFPRFKSSNRYNSFEYPVEQRHAQPLSDDRLKITGIGSVRIRLSRKLPDNAKIKIVRVVRHADGWYVQLVCEMARPCPLPKTGQVVGVDVGIATFVALSTGELIDNPHTLKKNEHKLSKANRVASRRKRGSNRQSKAYKLLARHHQHVTRARKHFHHQVANHLVLQFDEIHVENLSIRRMIENHRLAKAITDVSWANFFLILSHKAEWAGRFFIKKKAYRTSMTCSKCGHLQYMPLSVRVFTCQSCPHSENRDTNAGKNILQAENSCQSQ